MEIFVWAIIISIGLFLLMIPLALAVGGLGLLVNAIRQIFYRRS